MVALHLLLILLLVTTVSLLGGGGLLSADTAGAATAEGRGKGEVNVLLGVETDDEGRNVDDLLADTDVALADENTSVVDGLGEAELVDASLEATLKEILDLQGKDVIELHAGLVEDTDTHETANQGVTLEEALGVLLVKGQELTVMGVSKNCAPPTPKAQTCVLTCATSKRNTYRAARRILERVSWTRQTSRLLRRPYSPTSLSSESLLCRSQFSEFAT